MPPILYKVIAALGVVFALNIGVRMFASHHYDKGVAACELAQEKANQETEPLAKDLGDEIEDANDDYQKETNTIRTEVRTGLSAIDLERARRDGVQDGKEIARAKIIAEYRLAGGCLNDKYADDDKLLIDARRLQSDIFGDSFRGDGASGADKVREAGEVETIPAAPPSGYKRPD